MSLLMDALKKAEQEKKDAAKRLLTTEDDLSVTRKDVVADITDSHLVINTEPVIEPEAGKLADNTYSISAMDLSLEPLEASANHPLIHKQPAERISASAQYPAVDSDITLLNVTADTLSLKPEFESVDTNEVELSDKTQEINRATIDTLAARDPDHTLQGVHIGKPLVAGLYDDTIQSEPFRSSDTDHSYDETLPGVPAAQLARDIGIHDQPTPVAAQTLFTATNTITKSSSGFKWLLISLCIFAVASTIVVYYYSVTPVPRNIPSPLVAKGVETIISSQDLQAIAASNRNPADVPPVDSGSPVTDLNNAADSSAEVMTSTDNAVDNPAQNGPVSGTGLPADVTTVQEPPAATVPTDSTPIEPVAAEALVQDDVLAVTGPASTVTDTLPSRIEPPASLVKISSSMNSAPENQLVGDAFSAYQQADYELARLKYEQAYQRSPDNRDVLLGLAAVATKTGDTARALQIYVRLVHLNPLDNVARAALIGIQPGEDLFSSISSVKSMLYESPEQPSLYFTLGRLYASQAKWAEAQQAFFDAYRLDSANPDYAYNLAVSLDRLDQSQSALDYYTVALGLSESSPAGFDRGAIADRIQTLETR